MWRVPDTFLVSQRALARLRRLVAILVIALLSLPAAAAPLAEIEGTITWGDDFPAPEGALVSVRLVDLGRDGAGTVTLSEALLAIGRRPLAFRLVYDEALTRRGGTYRVVAEMRLGDSLVMRNRDAAPVLVTGEAVAPEIRLARVTVGRGEGSPIGREWTAETVFGDQVPPWARVWIRFDGDGSASGTNGCNTFKAEAPITEETLEFRRIATTRKACRPDQGRLETSVNRALEDTALWRIEDGRLTLSDAAGLDLMELRRGR